MYTVQINYGPYAKKVGEYRTIKQACKSWSAARRGKVNVLNSPSRSILSGAVVVVINDDGLEVKKGKFSQKFIVNV